jgi:NAD+ kinase
LLEGVDFMLSVGGDGTMLDTVAMVKGSGIARAGINFGRMGFFAATSKLEIEAAVNCADSRH